MTEKQGEPPSYEKSSPANSGNDGGGYTNWGTEQPAVPQYSTPPQYGEQPQPQYGVQPQPQYGVQPQPQYGVQPQPQYGVQPQPQYGNYNNVIVTQPQTNSVVCAPPDYLGLAVFATLLCCWPIGIMAIMRALDARRAVDRGDYVSATNDAGQARRLSIIAMVCGAVVLVITIVVVVVVVNNDSYWCYGYGC